MTETRRDQQKLWLILFQIKGVRARLNSLALQQSLFSTLAFLIGGAALIWGAALFLSPLLFLFAALAVAMFALAGIVRQGRRGLRQLANSDRAAAIADQRGDLKGRVATVLALAEAPKRSPLWPYLVEDAYSRREEFAPARIEPRWVSRSIFALLAAGLMALAIVFSGLRSGNQVRRTVAGSARGQITADIGNLEIRPADPALEPNAEIYADEKTLRKLEQRLAAAQRDADQNGLSRWMNKARNLAGDLQNELTGQKTENAGPPLQMRLTDRNPDQSDGSASNPSSQNSSGQNGSSASRANSGSGTAGDGQTEPAPPTTSMPGAEADQLARNKSAFPAQPGPDPADSAFQDFAGGGSGGGQGSSHGSGSDPNGLFGPDSSRTLGADNFKITIEAQASDESSRSGSPGYIPPRIRVPLNSDQYPDEPLERGSVPSADEAAIKRVFQR
ncbi:MAG TPA: hypothetical protein VEF07_06435 [Candidatus Binataceae bacterium]|nr:hypothetical protein [Candidatus Binataceae bacterium]